MWVHRLLMLVACLFVTVCALQAMAQPAPDSSAEAAAAGSAEGRPPWQEGPRHVALGHDVSIDIPEHYAFLERDPAAKLLEKNGSLYNDNLLGLVVGIRPEDDWFVVIRFDAEGYIKDDEKIDADEILKAIREGQEEANAERQKRGFSALQIGGWQEPPHYEKAAHHLVWGLKVNSSNGDAINYNTRILGRKGYVALNLVTDAAKLATQRTHATVLLSHTSFDAGARYEDFDSKNDKVAEYGLGGLVLAGAGLTAVKLVKIGLLAKFWKIIIVALVAGKKFLIIGLLALGAMFKNLVGKKKPVAPSPPSPGAPPGYAESQPRQPGAEEKSE
jgi:uncharacterized membrane-anchored protein